MSCVICGDYQKDLLDYEEDISLIVCEDCETRILNNNTILKEELLFKADYKYIDVLIEKITDSIRALVQSGFFSPCSVSSDELYTKCMETDIDGKLEYMFKYLLDLTKKKKLYYLKFNKIILENIDEILLFILDNEIALSQAQKKGYFTFVSLAKMTGVNNARIKKILEIEGLTKDYNNYSKIIVAINKHRCGNLPSIF